MDYQESNDSGHQQQQQRGMAPAPIAPNPGVSESAVNATTSNNQGSMLMGLMTNPALAAAAAASPLFPPAAMLTNPGAFFAMPEAFAAAGLSSSNASSAMQPQLQKTSIALQGMQNMPGITNNMATMYADARGNQVQHIQAGQHPGQPQVSSMSNTTAAASTSLMFPGAGAMHAAGNSNNSSVHAHMMAAAAAAQAVAEGEEAMSVDGKSNHRKDLSAAERAKQNRDRNREHARSTRLRKKAYVQKLKELVEGLHAERTEEVRQRRVAIQHLAEMQNVRRAVIRSFLLFHSSNERDRRKWTTLLEDDVWLKQPVTPYRSFRRSEIEHVSI